MLLEEGGLQVVIVEFFVCVLVTRVSIVVHIRRLLVRETMRSCMIAIVAVIVTIAICVVSWSAVTIAMSIVSWNAMIVTIAITVTIAVSIVSWYTVRVIIAVSII